MAKLYFRYGAMGSSKSANILMVRYNYEERGQYAVLLKPRTDNRDGEHEIKSRIGLEAPAEYVDEFLKNTNCPNNTNLCFIRLIRVIRGLLEVLKNTNDPNDTNINAAGLLESSKEHELSE